MTTKPPIPAAIVEKAANAKFKRAYTDDAFTWDDAPDHVQKYCRDAVVRALAPVYADIQAAALRDAALAWQLGGWADILPLPDDALPVLSMANHGAAWLRARADELDGGAK